MKQSIQIKTKNGIRKIGYGQPVFIVAEISGNHNQSYEKAKKIIDVAAMAGADAVKMQTYRPETMTIDCDKEYFVVKGSKLWSGRTLYDLYSQAYTPWEWQPKLKKYAESKGLIFFSTPFDNTAVDFLEKIKVSLYKVGSHELIDIPLLKRISKTRKPVIISRGMGTKEEIRLAIKTLRDNGSNEIAVLHCVSSYPAEPKDMNLKSIPDIIKKFKVVSGLSDHSLNNNGAVASVALGASIIEKHLTLKRTGGGVDDKFSQEPDAFKRMVENVREVELCLGKPQYGAGLAEKSDKRVRRSLFAVEDIKKGNKLTHKNIRAIRPGHGLAPKYYDQVIGKIALKNIECGTPLSWKLIK